MGFFEALFGTYFEKLRSQIDSAMALLETEENKNIKKGKQQLKRSLEVLEKFANAHSKILSQLGGEILIIDSSMQERFQVMFKLPKLRDVGAFLVKVRVELKKISDSAKEAVRHVNKNNFEEVRKFVSAIKYAILNIEGHAKEEMSGIAELIADRKGPPPTKDFEKWFSELDKVMKEIQKLE